MNNIKFDFNRNKAIEVILYLVPRIKNSDVYGICKLLYLADKTSLEKYGRFLFGETYCAMKQGATPSFSYDLLKEVSEIPTRELKVKDNQVIAFREYNPNLLSKSDVECLDETIKIFGEVPNWKRSAEAHDEAWKKNWDNRGDKGSKTIPVEDIAELLDDSEELLVYLKNTE